LARRSFSDSFSRGTGAAERSERSAFAAALHAGAHAAHRPPGFRDSWPTEDLTDAANDAALGAGGFADAANDAALGAGGFAHAADGTSCLSNRPAHSARGAARRRR